MADNNIIRAWKDEDYFDSLSEEERVLVPENPAGMLELSDEDMESVAGGSELSQQNCSFGCQITVGGNCKSFMCNINFSPYQYR